MSIRLINELLKAVSLLPINSFNIPEWAVLGQIYGHKEGWKSILKRYEGCNEFSSILTKLHKAGHPQFIVEYKKNKKKGK